MGSSTDPTISYHSDIFAYYTALQTFFDITGVKHDRSTSSRAQKARSKLLKLSSSQFYELSTDVYDELKRRINEDQNQPEYLLPKANFHIKRNQARQKLANLSQTRFNDLVDDILFEIRRRKFDRAPNDTSDEYIETAKNIPLPAEIEVPPTQIGAGPTKHLRASLAAQLPPTTSIQESQVVPKKASIDWSSEEETDDDKRSKRNTRLDENKSLKSLKQPEAPKKIKNEQILNSYDQSSKDESMSSAYDISSNNNFNASVNSLEKRSLKTANTSKAISNLTNDSIANDTFQTAQVLPSALSLVTPKSLVSPIKPNNITKDKTIDDFGLDESPKHFNTNEFIDSKIEPQIIRNDSSISNISVQSLTFKSESSTPKPTLSKSESDVQQLTTRNTELSSEVAKLKEQVHSMSRETLQMTRENSSDYRNRKGSSIEDNFKKEMISLSTQISDLSIENENLKQKLSVLEMGANGSHFGNKPISAQKPESTLDLLKRLKEQYPLDQNALSKYISNDGLIPAETVYKLHSLVIACYESLHTYSDNVGNILFENLSRLSNIIAKILVLVELPEFKDHVVLLKASLSHLITAVRYFSVYGPLLPKITVQAAISDLSYAICKLIETCKIKSNNGEEWHTDSIQSLDGEKSALMTPISPDFNHSSKDSFSHQLQKPGDMRGFDIEEEESPVKPLKITQKKNLNSSSHPTSVRKISGTGLFSAMLDRNSVASPLNSSNSNTIFSKATSTSSDQAENRKVHLKKLNTFNDSSDISRTTSYDEPVVTPTPETAANKKTPANIKSNTKLPSVTIDPIDTQKNSTSTEDSVITDSHPIVSKEVTGIKETSSLDYDPIFTPTKVITDHTSNSNNPVVTTPTNERKPSISQSSNPPSSKVPVISSTTPIIASKISGDVSRSPVIYEKREQTFRHLLDDEPVVTPTKSKTSNNNTKEKPEPQTFDKNVNEPLMRNTENLANNRPIITPTKPPTTRNITNDKPSILITPSSTSPSPFATANKHELKTKSMEQSDFNEPPILDQKEEEAIPNAYAKKNVIPMMEDFDKSVLSVSTMEQKVDTKPNQSSVLDSPDGTSESFTDKLKKFDSSMGIGFRVMTPPVEEPNEESKKVIPTHKYSSLITEEDSQGSIKSKKKSKDKKKDSSKKESTKKDSTKKHSDKNTSIDANISSSTLAEKLREVDSDSSEGDQSNVNNLKKTLDSADEDSTFLALKESMVKKKLSLRNDSSSEKPTVKSSIAEKENEPVSLNKPTNKESVLPIIITPSKNSTVEPFEKETHVSTNKNRDMPSSDIPNTKQRQIDPALSIPSTKSIPKPFYKQIKKETNNPIPDPIQKKVNDDTPKLSSSDEDEEDDTDSDEDDEDDEDETDFDIDAFDIENPDNTLSELLLYLEHQTVEVISTIQSLLSSIKQPQATKGELRHESNAINQVISQMVDATIISMNQSRNANLKEHGSWVVQSLKDCGRRMTTLCQLQDDGILKEQTGDGDYADKHFKQRLAGIAFDVAKCTKELVKTVEEASLKDEIAYLNSKLTQE